MASDAPVPPEARPYQGAPAGLVSRSCAGLVDAFAVAALLVGCVAGLNAVLFLLGPVDYRPVSVSWPALVVGALAVSVGYLTVAWSTTGRTYGCRLMGLRVLDRRGALLHFWVALVRATVCVAFPLGLAWCAVGSSRAALHDLITRSHVVYDWLPRTFTETTSHP